MVIFLHTTQMQMSTQKAKIVGDQGERKQKRIQASKVSRLTTASIEEKVAFIGI